MEPLLEVQNLRTEFPTSDGVVHAVNGISYTVMPGEAVGLVGESGCGKSISALSVLNLVPKPGQIAAGKVMFEGQDLLSLNDDQIRKVRGNEVAMIFQDPMTSLNPVLSVRTQMTEPLLLHKGMDQSAADKRAIELLELVERGKIVAGLPRTYDLDGTAHALSDIVDRQACAFARPFQYLPADTTRFNGHSPSRENDSAGRRPAAGAAAKSTTGRLELLIRARLRIAPSCPDTASA